MSDIGSTVVKGVVGAAVVGFVGVKAGSTILNQIPADAVKRVPPPIQSVALPNSAKPGRGAIHRNIICPDKLVAKYHPEINTGYDSFQYGARKFAKLPFLGTRAYLPGGARGDFVWRTYAEAVQEINVLASAFYELGLRPEDKVGLFMQNCEEWVIAAQACNCLSLTSVALYDTLGPDAVQFIVEDAKVSVVVCTKQNTAKILQVLDQMPSLKQIIEVHHGSQTETTPSTPRLNIISYKNALALGQKNPHRHIPPTPEMTYTISYTSGTTGNPKGVVLTHANICAFVSANQYSDDYHRSRGEKHLQMFKRDQQEVYISYLPLAHVYERAVQEMMFVEGTRIGFFQGDVNLLFEDIATLKPTIFASVPRIFNRLYDKVNTALSSAGGIKKKLFDHAYQQKLHMLRQGYVTRNSYWDKILFKKIQAILGGNVHSMITGSAPIASHVLDWFRIVFGCDVKEGYGQTETTAGASSTRGDDLIPGSVGVPNVCVEICLFDVPEMEYVSSNNPPQGEICFRGPSIFKGYYNNPAITQETIDEEGWSHSGDIGQWNPNGTLTIIDRKKNIFKLAQGEYVAPEKIENIYGRSKYVMQNYVHGDSLEVYLVGVVVPDPETVCEWAVANGIPEPKDLKGLCQNPKVKQLILEDMTRVGKEAGLRGFEFVKAIHLEADPFSVERGLITPTFKLMRPACRKHYHDVIVKLYEEVKAAPSAKL
eukprot:TRINITY_DN7433_c0_g1_i1.p1 TRINITY_DN7433_c0_g1~~TRINITY_DN7433_c0_g1_i1.p1  ORF type:complete len:710 (-),score=162.26 TRINITY_DN7433_c0_g1_i1:226-2355(-)